MKARWAAVAILALLALPAAAQPAVMVEFQGTARIGAVARPAQLVVGCAMDGRRVNALSLTLRVADAGSWHALFDTDPIEGPAGRAVAGDLVAASPGGTSRFSFPPSGSLLDTSFEFAGGFVPSPRGPAAKLKGAQGIVATLTQAPSQLTWRIANPTLGKPALEATIPFTDADAARLRDAAGPCMAK